MKKATLISYFGSQHQTAVALRVKQPTVCAWADDLPFAALGRIAALQPSAWQELNRDNLAVKELSTQSTYSDEN
jgi:hypothetical protein